MSKFMSGYNSPSEREEPTQEQIKEFWTWCEFDVVGSMCRYPDDKDKGHWEELPPIDLNNLFKYAVRILERTNNYHYIHFGYNHSSPNITTVQITFLDRLIATGDDDDPALALFWALYPVLKEKE